MRTEKDSGGAMVRDARPALTVGVILIAVAVALGVIRDVNRDNSGGHAAGEGIIAPVIAVVIVGVVRLVWVKVLRRDDLLWSRGAIVAVGVIAVLLALAE